MILGLGYILFFVSIAILAGCSTQPIVVDFSEIGNHPGQLVAVKGCVGENVSQREILNQGLPQDTQSRFFNFYADCKKTSPTVVLVFEKGDAYIDEGGTNTFIGRVEVTASEKIFLHNKN